MAIPVLQALDQAKTQSYHFKTIIISGMGFFTDAYDLYVIGILTKLLGRIYYYDPSEKAPGVLPINITAAVNGVALCGTLAGQLFFGWAGDKWGRKKVYGLTLVLMAIASLGQGLSFGHSSASVIATLCFFRFWLGFGVGGDYPLSATIMAEYSNKKTRGAFVAAVFAMQGIGYLAAGIVTIVVTAIFMNANPRPAFGDSSIRSNPNYSTARVADWVWRIVLMFGAVPAILTFYSRSQMPETARYTALIENNQAQAALDMEKVLQITGEPEFPKAAKTRAISHEFGLFTRQFVRRHGLHLFGTCMTWFLLDISYYSQSLFQPQVLSAANWLRKPKYMSALEETFQTAKWQTLLSLCSTIPGYWFTVFLVDRVGRKPIALMGFFFMSLFMYVLAFGWDRYSDGSPHKWDFIVLYGLTFFFSNFGPNATTFIIPAELFPARMRSTCHGISAAVGKAGAILGTFGFNYASSRRANPKHPRDNHTYPRGIGLKDSFILLASCSAVGFIIQLLCVPETMGRSLEDISGENTDNAIADQERKTQEAAE